MTPTDLRRLAGVCLALWAAAWSAGAPAAIVPRAPDGCDAPPVADGRALHAGPETLADALKRARGGDVIYLRSGQYGAVVLTGANAAFVTVAASEGQTPVLSSLVVRGSHWIVRGLTVVGLTPPKLGGQWQAHDHLVTLGVGDNVILERNIISSRLGAFPWRAETADVPDDMATSSGILTDNTACVTIVDNTLTNVFDAIQLGGDQTGERGRRYLVARNTVDDFAGDGIDHSVSDLQILSNTFTNAHNICATLCVHNDGIQGWNYKNHRGLVDENILIDGNRIIQRTRPQMLLPTINLQGITTFDGAWKNVVITNNVIITNSWHGITIVGADGLLIANNTIAGTDRPTPWIQVGGVSHEGDASRNVVVRNNIAMSINLGRAPTPAPNVVMDHNLVIRDPREEFVLFDVANRRYDLHLKRTSAARGHGSKESAPPLDIDGVPRSGPVNLGAYR